MAGTTEVVLVTGATGQQGGAVARALLAKGWKIRVMTRNPDKAAFLAKAGAEVVKGDFGNPSDLRKAMADVQGVFGVTTFFEAGVEAETKQGIDLADAAKAAGVPHFVYTSVGSADRSTGIPHFESKWRVEQHIRRIGLPYTVLRPVAFMENFVTYWKPSAEGVFSLPMKPEKKLALVALRDIGEFGAAAFLHPREFLGQAINLAGDELTMPDAAVHLSKTLGRSIRFQQFPDDQVEAAMGHDLALMFRWFNQVGYSINPSAVAKKFGVPLTTFADWIKTVNWAMA